MESFCKQEEHLSVSEVQCKTQCSQVKVRHAHYQYGLCYEKLDFYFSSSNNSIIQLGTKQHPFKDINALFDIILDPEQQSEINLYLDSDSENEIFLGERSLYFPQNYMVSIDSFSYDEEIGFPQKAKLYLKKNLLSPSFDNYNFQRLFLDSDQQLQDNASLNNNSKLALKGSMVIQGSQLRLNNIEVFQEVEDEFLFHTLPSTENCFLKINNCFINTNMAVYYQQGTCDFITQDSQFTSKDNSEMFKIDSQLAQNSRISQFEIENSIFSSIKANSKIRENFINLRSLSKVRLKNISFDDNLLKNLNTIIKVQTSQSSILEKEDIVTFSFENIEIKPQSQVKLQNFLSFQHSGYFTHQSQQQKLIFQISNISFKNLKAEQDLFNFKSHFRQEQISLSSVTIADCSLQKSFLQIDSSGSFVNLQDIKLEKNEVSQILKVKAQNFQLDSLKLSDIQSLADLNKPLFDFQGIQVLQVSNLHFKGIIIEEKEFINLERVQQIEFSDVKLEDLRSKRSIFNFQEVQKLNFKSFQGHSVQIQGYLFEQNALENDSQAQNMIFERFDIENSQLGFLKFGQIAQIKNKDLTFKANTAIKNSNFKQIYLNQNDFISSHIQLLDALSIEIENTDFLDFTQENNEKIIKSSGKTFFSLDHCLFSNFQAQVFYLEAGNEQLDSPLFQVFNSRFEEGFSQEKGVIELLNGASVYMEKVDFTRVGSLDYGGVFFSDSYSSLTCEECDFNSNYALYGAVGHTQNGSQLRFQNSRFVSNTSFRGGVLYISSNGQGILENCEIQSNSGFEGSIIYSVDSQRSTLLENVKIQRNQYNPQRKVYQAIFDQVLQQLINQSGSESTQGSIYLLKSQLKITGKTELKSTDNFIRGTSNSNVSVEDLTLQKLETSNFLILESSKATLKNLDLIEVSKGPLSSDFLFKVTSSSHAIFQEVRIQSMKIQFLYSFESKIEFLDGSVTDQAWAGSSYFFENIASDVKIANSNFTNTTGKNLNPILRFLEGSNVLVENVKVDRHFGIFMRFQDSIGKVKGMEMCNLDSSKIRDVIYSTRGDLEIDSLLMRDTNNIRGIVFTGTPTGFKDFKNIVRNSKFLNMRQNKVGTAIRAVNMDIEVYDSVFENLYAGNQGAGINSHCREQVGILCKIHVENSVFRNNVAGWRGAGINYKLYPPKLVNVTFEGNKAIRSDYGADISCSYSVQFRIISYPKIIHSGRVVPEPFVFEVVDHFNQSMIYDNNSVLSLGSAKSTTSLNGILKGTTKNGLISLDSFQAQERPGTKSLISFTFENLNLLKYERSFGIEYRPSAFEIEFHNCLLGEILLDNTCQKCQKGFYALEFEQRVCRKCEENIECLGGNELHTHKGYWRNDPFSLTTYKCFRFDSCLGGQNSECKKGHTGPLCTQCAGQTEDGFYARGNDYACSKCEEKKWTILKFISILIAIMLYVAALVAIIVQNPLRNNRSSVLFRILTNYFQIALLVRDLDLKWPKRVGDMYDAITFLPKSQEELFQINCLFQFDKTSPFVISLTGLVFLPIWLALGSYLFWIMMAKLMPRTFSRTYYRNSVTTTFVFTYLTYPTIVNKVMKGFQCTYMEGKYFLNEDFNQECWVGSHFQIIFFLIIPATIVWIIGFPIFVLSILKNQKQNLGETENIIKYGLFYIGLKDQYFYWELVVNNIRKILIIAVAFGIVDNQVKMLLIFSLYFAYHQLLKKCQPFNEEDINRIEILSTFASYNIIIMGIFFINDGREDEAFLSELIFYLMFLMNVAFLLNWIYLFTMYYFYQLKDHLLKHERADAKPLSTKEVSGNKKSFKNQKFRSALQKRSLEAKQRTEKTLKLQIQALKAANQKQTIAPECFHVPTKQMQRGFI